MSSLQLDPLLFPMANAEDVRMMSIREEYYVEPGRDLRTKFQSKQPSAGIVAYMVRKQKQWKQKSPEMNPRIFTWF